MQCGAFLLPQVQNAQLVSVSQPRRRTAARRVPSHDWRYFAFKVADSSMVPRIDYGDIVYAEKWSNDPLELIGEEVVCKPVGRPARIGEIYPGSKSNTFTLIPFADGYEIEDVRIEWVYEIRSIKCDGRIHYLGLGKYRPDGDIDLGSGWRAIVVTDLGDGAPYVVLRPWNKVLVVDRGTTDLNRAFAASVLAAHEVSL